MPIQQEMTITYIALSRRAAKKTIATVNNYFGDISTITSSLRVNLWRGSCKFLCYPKRQTLLSTLYSLSRPYGLYRHLNDCFAQRDSALYCLS